MFEGNVEFNKLADAYALAVSQMNDWIEASGADYDVAWDVANQCVDELLANSNVEVKEEPLKKYTILYFNRFVGEDQIYRIKAKSALWAIRLFYMRHDRKAYHACVTSIYETDNHRYATEADVRAYVERHRS